MAKSSRPSQFGSITAFRQAGVRIGSMRGMDAQRVSETFSGFKRVFDDLNVPLSSLVSVEFASYSSDGGHTVAEYRSDGVLRLNRAVFSRGSTIGRPRGLVSNTDYAIGAHEAAHGIVGSTLRRINAEAGVQFGPGEGPNRRAADWLENLVLTRASKHARKSYASDYARTNKSETIAEAVSDVVNNGGRAKKYSRAVYDSLRFYANAKYNVR